MAVIIPTITKEYSKRSRIVIIANPSFLRLFNGLDVSNPESPRQKGITVLAVILGVFYMLIFYLSIDSSKILLKLFIFRQYKTRVRKDAGFIVFSVLFTFYDTNWYTQNAAYKISSTIPCQRSNLPLISGGSVRMSIVMNIRGKSTASDEL